MQPSKPACIAGLAYYAGRDGAPLVTLKGGSDIMARVLMLARRYGVPVVEQESLADALQPLPLDEEIPEELFRAAAAILNELDRAVRR